VLPDSSIKILQPNDNLEKLGITQVVLKDLGPQIGWQTVFLIEYLGPLVIHPAFYFGFAAFGATHSSTQTLTLIMTVLHFLKREYETLNVHRFRLAILLLISSR
jgi:very-long-chain enoyl-CoA reductase